MSYFKITFQYMLPVTKYDRHGHKPRPRIIIITKESFYVLDGKNFKLKLHINLDKIRGKYAVINFILLIILIHILLIHQRNSFLNYIL